MNTNPDYYKDEPDFDYMPIEKIEQYLQEHGYDPEKVGLRGQILVEALTKNIIAREVIQQLLTNPFGCRFCDYGVLRKPDNPLKGHDEDCPYLAAHAYLDNETSTVVKRDLSDAEIEELGAAQKEALSLLPELERGHYYCDDCWYSCPKAVDGCCNESQGDECNCGADNYNALLAKIIGLLTSELDDYKRLLLENRNLKERIAELEAAQRWIPVSERLPEVGKVVHVIDMNDIGSHLCNLYETAVLVEVSGNKRFGFIGHSGWDTSDVTHWMYAMPLPTPPEVQE